MSFRYIMVCILIYILYIYKPAGEGGELFCIYYWFTHVEKRDSRCHGDIILNEKHYVKRISLINISEQAQTIRF